MEQVQAQTKCLFPALLYKQLPPLNECEPESSSPVVESVLFEKTFGLLHGFKETMKSWLAAALAISVASGIDFFGYKVIKPGTVVYIYGEGKMIRRLQRLCRGFGIPFPANLIPFKLRADLTKEEALSDLKQHIPEGAALIIIDNYEKYWWSSTDEEIVDAALKFIFEAKELTNILLVQHQPKHAVNKKSGHGNAIGSVRIVNSADSTIELKRRSERSATATFYHRDEDTMEEITFKLTKVNDDSFVIEADSEPAKKAEASKDKLLTDIEKVLRRKMQGSHGITKIYEQFLAGESIKGLSTKAWFDWIGPKLIGSGALVDDGKKQYSLRELPEASQKLVEVLPMTTT